MGLRAALQKLSHWRGQRRASPIWTLAVGFILALVLLPIVSVAVLALTPRDNIWPNLIANVLPRVGLETLKLCLGVGIVTLVVGTGTAWLVSMYRFPGRALIDRLLILPLAVPAYIAAYCYSDLFDYGGPIQVGLRALIGAKTARDYWFPQARSLPGAILVLSAVLYPYVYLAARASFAQQSAGVLEVARTLGRTPWGAFVSVALPLARPAIAAGVALALLETLNDLGATQHLGVETLQLAIFSTWQTRGNVGGAAGLALVMLVVVLSLLALERALRRGTRATRGRGMKAQAFAEISGVAGWMTAFVCTLPPMLGLGVPLLVLLPSTARALFTPGTEYALSPAMNSLGLSLAATAVTVLAGLFLAYARRVAANGFTRPAVRLSSVGYALPGTVLALGLLIPLAAFDNALDLWVERHLGVRTGLLISGSLAALVLALTIRFLALALGSIEAGLERISPNLDAAARTLGLTALQSLWRVHVPLLLPALGTTALLVFVDALKELPATLLMRPFNFETLATGVYTYANLDRFEEGAPGALLILVIGLLPVVLLQRLLMQGESR